jgi:hypothetical protein
MLIKLLTHQILVCLINVCIILRLLCEELETKVDLITTLNKSKNIPKLTRS